MTGPRSDKVAVVEEVRDQLERADAAILTEYRGLKVSDLAALRRALRGAGAEYKIYKNTLVRRATAETGQTVIDPMLEGPTGIAFVKADIAAAAKVLRDFARTNPALVVKGSLVGSELYDARTTTALADLPSREVLLAQIAGALAAPMRQFAGLLQALPRGLAYGISALIDQRKAAGDTSGDPVEPVPAPSSASDGASASGDETVASADDTAAAPAAEAPTDEAVADVSAEPAAAPDAGAAPEPEAADEAPVTDEPPAEVAADAAADAAQDEVSRPEGEDSSSEAAPAEAPSAEAATDEVPSAE